MSDIDSLDMTNDGTNNKVGPGSVPSYKAFVAHEEESTGLMQSTNANSLLNKAKIDTGPGSMPQYEAYVESQEHSVQDGARMLAQKPTGSRTKPTNTGKKDSWFAGFIAGLFCIAFAIPMVWMNERRQVKIYKTLTATQEVLVQNVDPFKPRTENDMEVVHM